MRVVRYVETVVIVKEAAWTGELVGGDLDCGMTGEVDDGSESDDKLTAARTRAVMKRVVTVMVVGLPGVGEWRHVRGEWVGAFLSAVRGTWFSPQQLERCHGDVTHTLQAAPLCPWSLRGGSRWERDRFEGGRSLINARYCPASRRRSFRPVSHLAGFASFVEAGCPVHGYRLHELSF